MSLLSRWLLTKQWSEKLTPAFSENVFLKSPSIGSKLTKKYLLGSDYSLDLKMTHRGWESASDKAHSLSDVLSTSLSPALNSDIPVSKRVTNYRVLCG